MKPTLSFSEFHAAFLAQCMVPPTLPEADVRDAWEAGQSPQELAEASDSIEVWIAPQNPAD